MIKRMIIMLLIVGLVLGSIYGFKSFQNSMIKKYMSTMSHQPQTVATMVAGYQSWNSMLEAVGTMRAVRGVDISSEVSGVVENIYFESGEHVNSGTLLIKLRSNDDLALLASLKADAHLANLTYERDLQQLKQKAIAQSVVDLDAATLEKSLALIQQQEAIIAKKYIRAPFTGRLGLRLVDLGEYLSPGTVIASLQELDPIYFDFFLPQHNLANIKLQQQVSIVTDLYPDKAFVGKIWAINSKVDQSSRNIQVRAILDNKDKDLLPGMYGVITINTGAEQKFITVPQTAITYNPYGDTVFIAKPASTDKDGKTQYIAEQRFITIGQTRGDQAAILTGLEAGETVVVAGQIKLQNGVPLNINNTVLPSNEASPKPVEY